MNILGLTGIDRSLTSARCRCGDGAAGLGREVEPSAPLSKLLGRHKQRGSWIKPMKACLAGLDGKSHPRRVVNAPTRVSSQPRREIVCREAGLRRGTGRRRPSQSGKARGFLFLELRGVGSTTEPDASPCR